MLQFFLVALSFASFIFTFETARHNKRFSVHWKEREGFILCKTETFRAAAKCTSKGMSQRSDGFSVKLSPFQVITELLGNKKNITPLLHQICRLLYFMDKRNFPWS